MSYPVPRPGPCSLCGRDQIVRYRLGDETLVGVCCVLAALEAYEEAQGAYVMHRLMGCPSEPCRACSLIRR